jgi:hypothetical protein
MKRIREFSWIDGQVYIIDCFLHFMAKHGYTLQKSRQDVAFLDLEVTMETYRDKELGDFRSILEQRREGTKEKISVDKQI